MKREISWLKRLKVNIGILRLLKQVILFFIKIELRKVLVQRMDGLKIEPIQLEETILMIVLLIAITIFRQYQEIRVLKVQLKAHHY